MALLFRVVYYKDGRDKLPLREVEINISPAVKWGTIIVLCTSFLFIGMILLKRYEAEATFQRVKQVKIPETGIEALLEYRKLIRAMDSSIYLNPLNSSYPAQKANFLYELAVNPSTKDILSGVEEFQNPQLVLASAEKLYKSALRINPINAEYYFGLAKIYSFNGEYELEGEVLLKTGILNPLDKRITR
jgi:tetratricopeptide (TPR) repeat protein